MERHELLLEEIVQSVKRFEEVIMSQDDNIKLAIKINGNRWAWNGYKLVPVGK